MLKNTSGQKIALFAFDSATGAPKTGDAGNITPYINVDWAGITGLTDTSASEISSTNAPGWYLFDVTQAETNGTALHFTAKSSTSNVVIVGRLIFTTDAASIAAIKAKTDNLPSDPADASDIAGAFSTVNSTLGTIAGYLDTEIAAIKAKTDLIPALERTYGTVVEGSPATNSAVTFRTDLPQTSNNHWAYAFLTFTGGALAGQTRRIAAFDADTGEITTVGFTETPEHGDPFIIVNV